MNLKDKLNLLYYNHPREFWAILIMEIPLAIYIGLSVTFGLKETLSFFCQIIIYSTVAAFFLGVVICIIGILFYWILSILPEDPRKKKDSKEDPPDPYSYTIHG